MKNTRIIAVLVLLALSLSGCANAERSEVSTPSSQETVTTEYEQSNMPQESIAISVSESTEITAESTAPTETVEAKSEVSIPAKEETPPVISSPTEATPPKASEPEPSTEPTETQPQSHAFGIGFGIVDPSLNVKRRFCGTAAGKLGGRLLG